MYAKIHWSPWRLRHGQIKARSELFPWRIVVIWITTQKVVSTCEDRSMYIFCDSVLQKNYYIFKNETCNPCSSGFYVKINLPQYVLTVTNLLEYKINIVANKLDILCFTSILCIFFMSRSLTSKGYFFPKQINSECLFWLMWRQIINEWL